MHPAHLGLLLQSPPVGGASAFGVGGLLQQGILLDPSMQPVADVDPSHTPRALQKSSGDNENIAEESEHCPANLPRHTSCS